MNYFPDRLINQPTELTNNEKPIKPHLADDVTQPMTTQKTQEHQSTSMTSQNDEAKLVRFEVGFKCYTDCLVNILYT